MLYLEIVASIAAVFILYRFILKRGPRGVAHLPLPPGPKGHPLIGNLRDLPSSSEWETYHQLCTKFREFLSSVSQFFLLRSDWKVYQSQRQTYYI